MTKFTAVLMTLFAGVVAITSMKTASADFLDGNTLRLYCASQNAQDDAVCIVYITGAFDAFTTSDLIAQKTSDAQAQFCIPDDTGPDQLKATLVEYMARPEANLDFSATLVILGAITDAYSCDK
jgi:hypothetical protein